MSKYVVVVADTKRARFFTVKDSFTPEVESSPKLVEEQDLLNAENSQKRVPSTGRNKTSGSGSYAFDDHRGKHALDELRRFAAIILKEALKQARKASAHTLVLVAERKTLGVIRAALPTIKVRGLDIHECDLELTGEPTSKIQTLLARRELIPAMKRPTKRARK